MSIYVATNNQAFLFSFPSTDAHLVAEAIRDFEYSYNVLSFCAMNDSGKSPVKWEELLKIVIERRQLGIDFTNLRLREMINDLRRNLSDQPILQIRSINSGSPIKIDFSGIEKALKVLASLFDPLHREELKEDLRHKHQKNVIAEQNEKLKLLTNKMKVMKAFVDMEADIRNTLPEVRADEAIEVIRAEIAEVTMLQHNKDVSIHALPSSGPPVA